MLNKTMIAMAAAAVAMLGAPAIASAHGHHYGHYRQIADNGLLVGSTYGDEGNTYGNDNENDEDVVSVAEPVYATQYVPVTRYVPVSDQIVTPYGYAPQYNNGYYQGYGYNPQYANNPYYAGAAYGGGDPVSTAVISTVIAAAANGGHLDGQNLLGSLLGGIIASQTQPQYQNYPQQYNPYPQQYQNYPQQYYPQQQYPPQQYYPQAQVQRVYVRPQRVYYARPQQYIQQYAPVIYRHDGERDREDHGNQGDQGNNDGGDD